MRRLEIIRNDTRLLLGNVRPESVEDIIHFHIIGNSPKAALLSRQPRIRRRSNGGATNTISAHLFIRPGTQRLVYAELLQRIASLVEAGVLQAGDHIWANLDIPTLASGL